MKQLQNWLQPQQRQNVVIAGGSLRNRLSDSLIYSVTHLLIDTLTHKLSDSQNKYLNDLMTQQNTVSLQPQVE